MLVTRLSHPVNPHTEKVPVVTSTAARQAVLILRIAGRCRAALSNRPLKGLRLSSCAGAPVQAARFAWAQPADATGMLIIDVAIFAVVGDMVLTYQLQLKFVSKAVQTFKGSQLCEQGD